MRSKELIKLLKQNGWQEISQKRFPLENEKAEIKQKLYLYIVKICTIGTVDAILKRTGLK